MGGLTMLARIWDGLAKMGNLWRCTRESPEK
jgi:hypothetical protein